MVYLHIGHAKPFVSISVWQRGIAQMQSSFRETNPVKEEVEYIDSIKRRYQWLGFDWEDRDIMHPIILVNCTISAIDLIKRGLA